MNDADGTPTHDAVAREAWIDEICDRYEDACRAGERPAIAQFLLAMQIDPEAAHPNLLRELNRVEGAYKLDGTETLGPEHLAESLPQLIGRYRVERVLGKGGFGVVYLARDEQLQRFVAIKVPHARLIAEAAEAEDYLAEARNVARLDHPNIVPIHDVGSSEQFSCFFVSKFIDGTDLSKRLGQGRLDHREAAELVATVAAALQHAHERGLVHRDIKPGNILLDASGKPFVGDFGLALREGDSGKGPRYAGTPAYMSPEQARGEGHRVNSQSDIFSLGAVFYELLVGCRPFAVDSQAELLERVSSAEVRPPREIDERIPVELERICLKSLSKLAANRYATAADLANDLRQFLLGWSVPESPETEEIGKTDGSAASTAIPEPPPATVCLVQRILPKGLRSFDAHDADFFLELLPGPRDRNGLPDSIRFWKARIEPGEGDSPFAVGLLYGPSGGGKSSLVKAGLLPRLSDRVATVYIEASASDTETRLLNGLRKRFPTLTANRNLKDAFADIRRGVGIPAGKKVLIVLDQFEQWLHANKDDKSSELVRALRQCDGGRLQCLVMVRDDFWLAISRFLKEIEVRLVEGQNSALVDLFDLDHARKVLAAFGRAFGRLPENPNAMTRAQHSFLQQATSGLAPEGKVVCVRLALFAEMMKNEEWTPATLKAIGGMDGVGMAFLEKTFGADSAPPEYRYHQKAARNALQILLPEARSDIKGHMRSHDELLAGSGYADRPKEFENLLRILDEELRLITPTDPEGVLGDGSSFEGGNSSTSSSQQPAHPRRYYQLTHDYLVKPIRDWLARKQKETRRGRAELLLAERAALWNARRENRQLPSLFNCLEIAVLTRGKNWTSAERQMMAKAGRYHAQRGLVAAFAFAILGCCAFEVHGRMKAHALQDRLLDANTADVPGIVRDMVPYRRWLDPLLQIAAHEAEDRKDRRKKLHCSLALLPDDHTQVDYLFERLLEAHPNELPAIRESLAPHKDGLLQNLWTALLAPENEGKPLRLRAAAALARYDPESEHWQRAGRIVVDDLVREIPIYLGAWSEEFGPVKRALLPPLCEAFRDRNAERANTRTLAANLLADYAADEPELLADLLMDADDRQFTAIFGKFQEHRERALPILLHELDRKLPAELPSSDERRERLAKRQANAAIALLRSNRSEKLWSLLMRSKEPDDPRLRSYLIHRLGALGVEPEPILSRLEQEADAAIRRALLLSLGGFDARSLSHARRSSLLPKVQAIYCTDLDPGIHAAAEWLLRTWDQDAWLKRTNEEWAVGKLKAEAWWLDSENGIDGITPRVPPRAPRWYVNGQRQTMVVIPGPVAFAMGSPTTEIDRRSDEVQHQCIIGRSFATAATPVTKEQFARFNPTFTHHQMHRYPSPTCPMGLVQWFEAAAYCNWLSEAEGIAKEQWCYEIAGTGTRLKANYLGLSGYRLPTEAEMEYATRAGALTSRYYGETDELLPQYAWFNKNAFEKAWPVGTKKPNDLGLFDMEGNIFTWCQESLLPYPPTGEAYEDREGDLAIERTANRVLRGGSFERLASSLRSARRDSDAPENRNIGFGFRPTRTIVREESAQK